MPVAYQKKYGKSPASLAKHPNQFWVIVHMAGDDAYLTGGYPFDFDAPILGVVQQNYVQYVWAWDPVNKKVKAMKFVDIIDSGTADGTLVEEDADTDMEGELIDFAVLVDHNV